MRQACYSVIRRAVVEDPHFRPWLTSFPGAVAAKVVDGIEYLRDHGRGAVLLDVCHHIQSGRHFPDMSKVRADRIVDDRRFVIRVVVCIVDADQTLLVCIGDNKNR